VSPDPKRARPSFNLLWTLLRRTFVSAYRHNQFGLAKGAAYSALLSFFPLLATLATILVRVQAEFVYQPIYDFLSQVLPPGAQDLVVDYFTSKGKQPVLLPLTGMLISLWAASGVITSLMEGFRAAYGIPSERSFLHETTLAMLLVVATIIPVLAASVLILFGGQVERWLGLIPAGVELRGGLSVLFVLARHGISLGAIVSGAAILYYFGPNRPQRWRRVWPGAVLATALWFATTLLFAWYVRNIANYNVMYGSIAAVIALLVWMYLLALIAFIGCEFNAEWEKMDRGS
jgi:membrane protein